MELVGNTVYKLAANSAPLSKESTLLPDLSSSVSNPDGTNDAELGPAVREVWDRLRELLKHKIDPQIFAAWIKPLHEASLEQTPSGSATLTLLAPNKFSSDHVQRHYSELISTIASTLIGAKETALVVKVSSQPLPDTTHSDSEGRPGTQLGLRQELVVDSFAKGDSAARGTAIITGSARASSRPRATQYADLDETNLNPKYNFSNYIVGGCNQFAHAACLKVAENPGHTYNPLFLYGGVGLGKTHLANAIGNASRRRKKKSLLISSETFVSELISSLRSNTMDRFKSKFRSLDVLIVDDIQFLIGKERTQEEFFHTFNDLYNRHKQIIITSDKIPQELTGLEERLRTRFACGLSADLQAPDFETRVAILNKKSEMAGIALSNEVASLLAERIDTNVRELEGALNRLQAHCSLEQCEPTLRIAEKVLESIAPEKIREVTTELIQKVIATKYNVSFSDLLGKRRTHNIAFARQVAMYLCRQMTSCSYPELGALFGGRDHSTVIHAHKVITERLNNDKSFANELKAIKKDLSA